MTEKEIINKARLHVERWKAYKERKTIFINLIKANLEDLKALDTRQNTKIIYQSFLGGCLHILAE